MNNKYNRLNFEQGGNAVIEIKIGHSHLGLNSKDGQVVKMGQDGYGCSIFERCHFVILNQVNFKRSKIDTKSGRVFAHPLELYCSKGYMIHV